MLCHSDVDFVDLQLNPLPHRIGFPAKVQGAGAVPRMFLGNPIITSTVLLRRDALDRVGRFDESMNYAEDYDLWLRIAKRYELAYVDCPLVRYRVHAASATAHTTKMLLATRDLVRRLLAETPSLRTDLDDVTIARRLARLECAMSRFCYSDRQYLRFAGHAINALGLHAQTARQEALPPDVSDRLRWYCKRLGL